VSDFASGQLVRGRKQHRCMLCGLRIRQRARHWSCSGIWDGQLLLARYHEVCMEATRDWDATDWESFSDEAEFRVYSLGMRR
jgi:hypothetical protein